jgi:hypothetical protein
MDSTQSMLGGFARLFWMAIGPAAMAFFGYSLVVNRYGWTSGVSLTILVLLALVIGARWSDPHNSLGEPTTPDQLRNYTLLAVPLGLAFWGAVNFAASHWLS